MIPAQFSDRMLAAGGYIGRLYAVEKGQAIPWQWNVL
jgi:hypothetical protein